MASKNSRRSCPCQHISLSLSSATAAEYGDIESLSHRLHAKRSDAHHQQGGITNGGITPLHLAAQHDHPAAVSLLLSEGGRHIDSGLVSNDRSSYCGATPLHRASFAGSVSAMQILLQWGSEQSFSPAISTDLLAKDESFGDLRTPLHKAVAGGRPLAVQLLLMSLRQRKILSDGLAAVDSQGLTALQLAQQFTRLETEELEREKCSLRRWDSIAGGPVDWVRCLSLLQSAAASSSMQELTSHNTEISALNPFENTLSCADGNGCEDGICRTAAWENAFRSALTTSLQSSHTFSKPTIDNDNRIKQISTTSIESNNSKEKVKQKIQQDEKDTCKQSVSLEPEHIGQFGRVCDTCQKQVVAFFRYNGMLLCRECKRTRYIT